MCLDVVTRDMVAVAEKLCDAVLDAADSAAERPEGRLVFDAVAQQRPPPAQRFEQVGMLPVAERPALHRVDELPLANVAVVPRNPLAAERGANAQLDSPRLQVAFAVQQRHGVERRHQPLEGAGPFVPAEKLLDRRRNFGFALEELHARRRAVRHKWCGRRP